MKKIILLMLLLYNISANAQYLINTNNEVSNFHVTASFNHSYKWDFDVNKMYDQTEISTGIAINVEENGQGYLSVYIQSKVRFFISKCTKKEGNFSLSLINNNGDKKTALLVCEDNHIKSFWLYNNVENTAIVFY